MATPQEMMFINIAVQKGYLGKGTAEYILSYQKEFENKGQKIILVNYLLAKKILSPTQTEEIKSICISEWQTNQKKTPSLSVNETTSFNSSQTSSDIKTPEDIAAAKKKQLEELRKIDYQSISSTQKLNRKDINDSLTQTTSFNSSQTSDIKTPDIATVKRKQLEELRKIDYQSISSTQKLNRKDIYNSLSQTKKYKTSDFSNTIPHVEKQTTIEPHTEKLSIPIENQAGLDINADTGKIKTGDIFAKYQIEKEIGQGGMGFVYLVHDTKLQRNVALKIVSLENQVSEKRKKRFIQEIKATAQLNHLNIVKVLESGEVPQSYFTMEYLEGGTLADLISKGPIKAIQAATITYKIADALYYAHKNGIIHRDIKPSNIMFDKNKEPKLMDFGLSKIIDIDDNLSKSGEALGTPQYMSPEQANGNDTEAKSDIYSLGTTLYEMITAKQVFDGDSYYDILNKIFHEEPIPPRAVQTDIPKDLEAICLKCLDKKPKNRYHNARALAKDLRNFIEHKSVSARPTHGLVKLSRTIKKNKIKILLTTLTIITCILFAIQHYYIKYQFQVRFLESFSQLQQEVPVLRSEALFSSKVYSCFREIQYYEEIAHFNLLNGILKENQDMLQLHLLSFPAIQKDDVIIDKWVDLYENFIRNNNKYPIERYYYNINSAFLYLLQKKYSEAQDKFLLSLASPKPDKMDNATTMCHNFYCIYASFFAEKDNLFHSENTPQETEMFEKIKSSLLKKHANVINKTYNIKMTYDIEVFKHLEHATVRDFIKYCKSSKEN